MLGYAELTDNNICSIFRINLFRIEFNHFGRDRFSKNLIPSEQTPLICSLLRLVSSSIVPLFQTKASSGKSNEENVATKVTLSPAPPCVLGCQGLT